ncbi:MAG: hypothetical protein RL091_2926 [Verrucomicrobiota bacterium]|jgi:hypothetical protein
MKFVFLSGGLTGFVLGLVTSWLLDHPADRVLFDAAVSCLVGAVLFRWFWSIVLSGLRETVVARHEAAQSLSSSVPATVAAAKGK